ncbi:hypothetical protein R3P38DRAFT_2859861 [Favolaschia claudopus]|uniref:Secreted protein n=1 Tax=Favolaschia claudopus TaxID=2862362 RepID=A0AAW0DHX3_9AGAR
MSHLLFLLNPPVHCLFVDSQVFAKCTRGSNLHTDRPVLDRSHCFPPPFSIWTVSRKHIKSSYESRIQCCSSIDNLLPT